MEAPIPSSYEAALRELQQLLQELEQGEVAIDSLQERLDRAKLLLAFCRERLRLIGNPQ